MAVRNRIRRGLGRAHWRGATGLALTLLVGGLFLWAAQLAWAVGKGKESVEADLPEVFASAATTKEAAETKRLKSELKSLRAENEQLMQAIQMLAEEIQWLHGEGQTANWPRDDARKTDPDKPTSKSNKIHPEFAAELFALEQELMDEIDAPAIEAELKRRLDEFRGALAESSDGDESPSTRRDFAIPATAEEIQRALIERRREISKLDKDDSRRTKIKFEILRLADALRKDRETDHAVAPDKATTSELENFRQEYKNYITERLEYFKGKRKVLFAQGTLTIEYATAIDTLILDLMEKLLALKKEEAASSRPEETNRQSQSDYPTYPAAIPALVSAPPASSIGKPDPQSTGVATATPASEDSRGGLDNGEFKIKISPEGKAATVSFFDPSLNLVIHIETSRQKLPALLERLSQRSGSADNSPPVPAGKNAVPIHADPPPATFEADPFSKDEIESAPPQPGFDAKPTNPAAG